MKACSSDGARAAAAINKAVSMNAFVGCPIAGSGIVGDSGEVRISPAS